MKQHSKEAVVVRKEKERLRENAMEITFIKFLINYYKEQDRIGMHCLERIEKRVYNGNN